MACGQTLASRSYRETRVAGREELVHDCRESRLSDLKGDAGMASAILEFITMNLSKILEALFDEIEYHLATRALHRSRKIRAKRRPRSKLIIEEGIPT